MCESSKGGELGLLLLRGVEFGNKAHTEENELEREKLTEWRKLRNEELSSLFPSPKGLGNTR